MLQKKCANGYYAAEGMQFVEKIAGFRFSRCGCHAGSEADSPRMRTAQYIHGPMCLQGRPFAPLRPYGLLCGPRYASFYEDRSAHNGSTCRLRATRSSFTQL